MGRERVFGLKFKESERYWQGGGKAVHVQIYVDSLTNFCPCESLKCSEEGCLT